MLSTEVGEHVVYHWDADAGQLCGGTVAASDAVLEGIPRHYGLALAEPAKGPTIEYFWTAGYDLADSLCSWSEKRTACMTYGLVAGATVYSPIAIHDHELAHAALHSTGTRLSVPDFVDEGFASRWTSVLFTFAVAREIPKVSLTEARLRGQFAIPHSKVDYMWGHAWWASLELSYGPSKMGELLVALEFWMSADEVDAVLREVLGISLAESAELTTNVGYGYILDDPACTLTGLPSHAWNGEPIVLDRGPASCADADVINGMGNEVFLAFELLLPSSAIEVAVEVVDLDPDHSATALVLPCNGSFESHDFAHEYLSPNSMSLHGRVIVAPLAELRSDGTIEFPRVRISAGSP